jgi:hypothetical protein
MKLNCWEFKKCGREPGGNKISELGICPSAIETRTNGINEGKNGGRACWAIAGTLCGGKTQGTLAQKFGNCFDCEFYNLVIQEEDQAYVSVGAILSKLEGH